MKNSIHHKHVAMSGFSFPIAAKAAALLSIIPAATGEFTSCAIENANRYAKTDMVCEDITQAYASTTNLATQFTHFVESYTNSSAVVDQTFDYLSDQITQTGANATSALLQLSEHVDAADSAITHSVDALSHQLGALTSTAIQNSTHISSSLLTLSQHVDTADGAIIQSVSDLSSQLTTTTESSKALGNAVVSMVDAFLSLADGSFGSGPLRDTLNELSDTLHDQGYSSETARRLTEYANNGAFHEFNNPMTIALGIGIPLVILGVLSAAEGKVSGERTGAASLLGIGLYLAVTTTDTILGNIVRDISAVALVLTGVALTLHNAYTTANDPARQKTYINTIAKAVHNKIAGLENPGLKAGYSNYIETGSVSTLAAAIGQQESIEFGDQLTACVDKIMDTTAPRAPHVGRAARKIVSGLLIEAGNKHPGKSVDERLTLVETAITTATGWKNSWSGFHLETALKVISNTGPELVIIDEEAHSPAVSSMSRQDSISDISTSSHHSSDTESNPSIHGSDVDIEPANGEEKV